MDREAFFSYLSCPRGAGDRQAHRIKDLWHVWLLGRHSCVAGEVVHQLRGKLPYAGVAP